MNTLRIDDAPIHTDIDWAPFSGGELEAPRPKAQCPGCREKANAARAEAGKPPLCFQCYRADLVRNRAIKQAAELDTASEARFQTSLPFEPVNAARLVHLKAEREAARAEARSSGNYAERRARAQIEARHALARIFQGLKARQRVEATPAASPGRESACASAARAAELQLPESWLPFVVSR